MGRVPFENLNLIIFLPFVEFPNYSQKLASQIIPSPFPPSSKQNFTTSNRITNFIPLKFRENRRSNTPLSVGIHPPRAISSKVEKASGTRPGRARFGTRSGKRNRGLTKTQVFESLAHGTRRGEARRSSRAVSCAPVLPDRRFTACISPTRVT